MGNYQKIRVNYKDYKVCKMSYGDYFLEPLSWKGGETEGFSKDTIWLKVDEENKNVLIGGIEK